MDLSTRPATIDELRSWREMYRAEMHCQIIHDSLHSRRGWTESHKLFINGALVGYGSIALGGPWKGKSAIFEFFVAPPCRGKIFELFSTLIEATRPVSITTQSNDRFLTVLLQHFGTNIITESILFQDDRTTALVLPGAVFRPVGSDDVTKVISVDREPGIEWVLELDGEQAATGGILFHYNPPYGDLWYEVAEPFRRRGAGSFLVQEMKRACYEIGHVPAARCNPDNLASRRTLQKAGFDPCGHILTGDVRYERTAG